MKVGFQGEFGAYSHEAIDRNFKNAEAVPFRSFSDVFNALEKKEIDCAMIPVENSVEGSVTPVYDLLLKSGVKAVKEVYLPIHHCLISGNKIEEIEEVYSHPQALAQCRENIRELGLKEVQFYDTAGSVKMLKETGKKAGALASKKAAQYYGLNVLKENMEDTSNNTTRFLVFVKDNEEWETEGKMKTSIVFGLKHIPGALYGVLKELSDRNINMTKIESRPTKETKWEYVFYIDFEGSFKDEKIKDMLGSLDDKTYFVKVIGSYPAGE